MLKRLVTSLASIALGLVLLGSHANAQASRTWVSGVGDDVNPCSRTAPCKTFAGAISKTAVNGEINCMDPGGYGAVTITKSITIDCTSQLGSILNAGTNGINIAYSSFDGSDVRRTVRLRGLLLQGFNIGLAGINITGGLSGANASSVFIENVAITGNFGGSGRGIVDTRVSSGLLSIKDTTITNLGGPGVVVAGAAGSSVNFAVLDRVTVQGASYGLAVGNGNYVTVTNSTFAGNAVAGVEADSGAQVIVSNSVLANNAANVQAIGAIRLGENYIQFSNTAIQGGGAVSLGGNRFSGNATMGTTPPLATGAPADTFN